MDLIDAIKRALKAVWEKIKKIFLKILNFFRNISNWFRQPERLKKLQQNEEYLAIAIKENLDSGNYNVVNCLFDQKSGELVDYKEDTLAMETESLDSKTLSEFGNKDMIILR